MSREISLKTRKEINDLITEAIKQLDTSYDNIKTLKNINSEIEVLQFLYLDEIAKRNFCIANIIGILKCLYDTSAEEFPKNFDVDLKFVVDKFVLNVLNRDFPEGIWTSSESKLNSNFMAEYHHLSKLVCGFGDFCSFSTETFKTLFPASINRFVKGFANGYSKCFQLLCRLYNVKYEVTHPITQDIWKNIRYFLINDCYEYSLTGDYIFPYYDGQFNPTGNPKLPDKYNHHTINEKTYTKLKKKIHNDDSRKSFSYELNF